MVHQRVQHFFEKRKSGTIKDTYVEQRTAKHTSAGDFIAVAADQIELHAPQFNLPGDLILASSSKTAIITDVTETYEHSEQITRKKRGVLGSQTKSSSSMALAKRSLGAILNVGQLKILGLEGVKLRNVLSRAERNQLIKSQSNIMSAGLLHELSEIFKIPDLSLAKNTEFQDYAKYHLAKASVSTVLNISIHGKEPEQAMLDGLLDAAITSAFAPLIQKIDVAFDRENMDIASHNILHATVGAAKSAILDDPNGAIIGALEGIISARLPRV